MSFWREISNVAEVRLKKLTFKTFSPLKEGPDTPPGTVVYRVKAFDADGDDLTFGLISSDSNADLVDIVNESNEASIVLKRELDAESQREHQLVLTLTDDR